jgi:hypothetical protein
MLYRFDGSPNGYLNGWARFLGLVGVPGAISIYLVWWLCVQERPLCSAGVSPAGARARGPVAWMAGPRETGALKPIDKAIGRDGEQVTGLQHA